MAVPNYYGTCPQRTSRLPCFTMSPIAMVTLNVSNLYLQNAEVMAVGYQETTAHFGSSKTQRGEKSLVKSVSAYV